MHKLCSFALCLFFTILVKAQSADKIILEQNYALHSRTALVTDLNADGKQDIFTVCMQSVGVFINMDSTGQNYDPHNIFVDTIGGSTQAIAADLDGDLDTDIALLNELGSGMQTVWLENEDGSGLHWEIHTISFYDYYYTGFYVSAVNDFDNDGDPDILASLDEYSLCWYENDGAGNFDTVHPLVCSYTHAKYVLSDDFDTDGNIDLMLYFGSNELVLYTNPAGDGNFTENVPQYLQLNYLSKNDIDMDGDMDITYFNDTYWSDIYTIFSLKNIEGTGVFSTPDSLVQTGGYLPWPFLHVDADNDGDDDILLTRNSGSKVFWYKNTAGIFDTTAYIMVDSVKSFSGFITTGLLNTDSMPDLVFISREVPEAALNTLPDTEVFAKFQLLPHSNRDWKFVHAADINNDSLNEFFLSDDKNGKFYWYDWNIAGDSLYTTDSIIQYGLGYYPVSFADHDFNGDGYTDIFVGGIRPAAYAKATYWYRNDAGTLSRPYLIDSMTTAKQLWFADVDADGDEDVIASIYSQYGGGYYGTNGNKLQWYARINDSTFSVPVLIAGPDGHPDSWNAFDIADYDMDGDMDVLSESLSNLYWFKNIDGAAGFTDSILIDHIGHLSHILSSDIDSDGDTDVLCVRYSINEVHMIENTGIEFLPAHPIAAFDPPTNTVAYFESEDVNNDGRMDFVTSSDRGYTANTWISLNSPGGSFGDETILSDDYGIIRKINENEQLDFFGYNDYILYWIPDLLNEASDVDLHAPAPGDISEDGLADSILFRLVNIPEDTVVIAAFTNMQIDLGAGAGTALYFTLYPDSSAILPQVIYVHAADDTLVEGLHTAPVTVRYDSGFGYYDGTAINEVNFIIADNDTAIIDTSVNIAFTDKTVMAIYPNPVSNILHVISEPAGSPHRISIFNLEGNLIRQQINTEGAVQINVQNIPDGFYIIELNSGHAVLRQKIIILHQ